MQCWITSNALYSYDFADTVNLKLKDIKFCNLLAYHDNLNDKQNCLITGYAIRIILKLKYEV